MQSIIESVDSICRDGADTPISKSNGSGSAALQVLVLDAIFLFAHVPNT